ncbi:MAG: ComF family protein, partial [Pirellulaceae bacterium]|nr:ComF family protein [Pirellulaceae bacterium]
LRSNIFLCEKCLARLGPKQWLGCRRCGAPVDENHLAADDCPKCKHARFHFDAVVVLGNYHKGLSDAVLRMKRPSHDPLSLALGRLLCELRGDRLRQLEADLVMAVPMHWRRRLATGKNSPELIAQCIAKSIGVPLRSGVLVKHRNTPPQKGLTLARRMENIRGSFRVRRAALVKDARVLLVDDVMTTGATGSEAAKTLKRAGAAMVAVAVAARA